ncbi:hypothetical protein NUT44_00095 [Staphylococcus haemolyticus]|uniref:hypothetical protein n=1 Tax=Staphylococcus haemolyticus TaxID=1283 RepID=UPI0024830E6B|nr:hypothetical protein [Staphylococcus haemolyticus]UUY82058.2 hypothetical protein NUT44_00095 [Staphylococcus haemolyticus]
MKVSQLRGEADRLSELTGYLDEKAKAYREEGDILGAEAIELIILDDLGSDFDSVYGQFQEEIKTWEQKYKRFENVCIYYGISVPTLKIIISFNLEKELSNNGVGIKKFI